MWLPLALSSAVVFSIAGILFKANNQEHLSSSVFFLYMYLFGAMGLLAYTLLFGDLVINFETAVSGALIGVGLSVGNSMLAKALKSGPISLTSPLVNINIIFLVVGAVIFYGEELTIKNIALVIVLVASILVLPIDPREKITIIDRRWYFLVILASLFFSIRNGGLKVTNEMGLDYGSVLFVAYLLPTIWFFILAKNEDNQTTLHSRFYGGIAGLFSVAGMTLYSAALLVGPASLVIPVFSTYNVFLVALAFLFFKERLTAIQSGSVMAVFLAMAFLR